MTKAVKEIHGKYTYRYSDGTTIKIRGKQADRVTALVQTAPAMLEVLNDIKFTFESVKDATTIGELLDLYEKVSAVVARAEQCR